MPPASRSARPPNVLVGGTATSSPFRAGLAVCYHRIRLGAWPLRVQAPSRGPLQMSGGRGYRSRLATPALRAGAPRRNRSSSEGRGALVVLSIGQRGTWVPRSKCVLQELHPIGGSEAGLRSRAARCAAVGTLCHPAATDFNRFAENRTVRRM